MFKYPKKEHPTHKDGFFYFYILECSDNSFYTGSSQNLMRRIQDHNSGKAAKWTKERRPVQLVYFEVYGAHLAAQRREMQIKGWTKTKKEKLISGEWKQM